jgi:hypothetical protein
VAGNDNVFFAVPPPQIASLAPNIGGSGNTVTITGTNFGATSATGQVAFIAGGVWTPSSWSNTQIVATVPSGGSTGGVWVSVNSQGSNLANYTVPNHVISSVSPTNGPVTTQVTVNGTGFGASQGSSVLTFNGQPPASISSWSNTQIVATVPDTATTGPVKLTVDDVPGNINVIFTVPAARITGLTPLGGPVGTQFTVTGTGFQANQRDSVVTINGTQPTVVSWSNTEIVANVAAGNSTGPVEVTVNAVPSTSSVYNTFEVPSHTVTSLTPPSGSTSYGNLVTVHGSGFKNWYQTGGGQAIGQVMFNGASDPAPVSSWSDTSITVSVPSSATSGPVSVTRFGVTNGGPTFTVTGEPNVTALSPAAPTLCGSFVVKQSVGSRFRPC